MAKQTVAIDLQATTKGAESVKSLKQQIKEAQAEAIQLSRKFGDFSPEATKAAQKVAALRDEMGDFQQRVAALNPDKFQAIAGITQGIAGGISAMTGAMALFGAESEETQKLMAKVQGAIAFSTGVQQLLDLKNSFGAVATMIKTNVVAAFTTLKGAMMATGIGLVITALAALVQHLESVAEEAENTKQKLDDLKNFYERVWQLDEQDMQIAINRAKARGASEREILQIQLDANKRRVADLREQQKAGADVDNEILQQRKQAEILITAFEAQEAANRKAAQQKAYEEQLEAERKHQKEMRKLREQEQQIQLDGLETHNRNIEAEMADFDDGKIKQIDKRAEYEKYVNNLVYEENKKIWDGQVKAYQKAKEQERIAAELTARAKVQAEQMAFQSAAQVFGAMSQLYDQGSKQAKAFALAQIAVDTARAISSTIREARNAAANTPAPPPIPQITAAAIYASGVAQVIGNMARAKQILNGGTAGGGGAMATPNSPQASFVPLTTGMLPDNENAAGFAGMGRVYVLEGDITNTQRRVRRIKNVSVV